MQGPRVTATIEVSWNLDLIPGWNHNTRDMLDKIEQDLVASVSHYYPEVRVIEMPDNPFDY